MEIREDTAWGLEEYLYFLIVSLLTFVLGEVAFRSYNSTYLGDPAVATYMQLCLCICGDRAAYQVRGSLGRRIPCIRPICRFYDHATGRLRQHAVFQSCRKNRGYQNGGQPVYTHKLYLSYKPNLLGYGYIPTYLQNHHLSRGLSHG